MGAFSNLKDAKRGFSSNPIQPGKYVVRIDGCDFFDTEQNGEMWKNTLTVLAVDEGSHRVGEIVHTFFRMKAGKSTFQSNLKSFLATVLGVDDEQIDEEVAKIACSEGSPMKGLVTIVTAQQRNHKTAKDEKTGEAVQYTVVSWTACLTNDEIVTAIGDEAYATFFPNG